MMFHQSPNKLERRWLRTVRSRVQNYIHYAPQDVKAKLLVTLDTRRHKRHGRKSHHQLRGYRRSEVIAHMAQVGLL